MNSASELAERAVPAVMTDLGEVERQCDKHGAYMARGTQLRTRDVWTGCPRCEQEQKEEADRRWEQRQAEKRAERLAAMLDQTAIPARFLGKSLDNYSAASDAQRVVLEKVRAYADNFPANHKAGRGLVLAGRPGTGKSHLAGAVLQSILPGHQGLYMTALGIIQKVRETWRRDSERSESQLLETLGGVSLLVVDEVGVQYGTEGEQTILFDVLDRRYRNLKPTIILTNQDSAGLKQFLGERVFDRLTETAEWIPCSWSSYRPTAGKEAAR